MTSMSVQLRPYPRHQAKPFLSKGADLFDLARMPLRDALKHVQFVVHHPEVSMWDYPASDHCIVSVQGLAGLDDAAVGFGGGHGRNVPEGPASW